jgi:hypothetical protein
VGEPVSLTLKRVIGPTEREFGLNQQWCSVRASGGACVRSASADRDPAEVASDNEWRNTQRTREPEVAALRVRRSEMRSRYRFGGRRDVAPTPRRSAGGDPLADDRYTLVHGTGDSSVPVTIRYRPLLSGVNLTSRPSFGTNLSRLRLGSNHAAPRSRVKEGERGAKTDLDPLAVDVLGRGFASRSPSSQVCRTSAGVR